MEKTRLQRFMRRSLEVVVTLLLVLIFFGLFTTLLFKIFPSGVSLSQIVEQRKGQGNGGRNGGGERGSVVDEAGTLNEKAAATLTMTENDVKSKNASSLAWASAKNGSSLFDRDAVQTFSQASARINFDGRNYLTMGSNSLVIIKKIEKDPYINQRRTVLVVVEGELHGQINSSGHNALNLDITTPSAVTRVLSGGSGAQKTDFRISINPDKSSSIVVYKGQAEVSAMGRMIKVGADSGVTVKQGQFPAGATRLPPAPALTVPSDRSVIPFRELTPRVRLAWAGKTGETFHLQLARDASFKQMVFDKRLAETEFVHGNLKKGSYFWRVSRVEEGREGRSGATRRFEIAQGLTPPPLQVAFPSGPVLEERFVLSGMTAAGVKILVGGKLAATDASGAFSHELSIRPGMNLVTVEAVDAAGNVTYRSKYVQGRF